ncbi:MAG: PAS domain S-box protein [Methanobacterium sp.]
MFREIFNKSPTGIFCYNKKGNLIDANPTALEIIGIDSIDDFKKVNLFDKQDIVSRKEDLLKKGLIRFQSNLNYDSIKNKGFYFPVKSGIAFIDGTISVTNFGFLVQIQDITEHKETEKGLKESQNHLEEQVEERTAELSKALEEAKKKSLKLDAIMEYAPIGIIITGEPPNFPIEMASRSGIEMTGNLLNELMGLEDDSQHRASKLLLPDGTYPKKTDMPLYRSTHFGEIVNNTELVMENASGDIIPLVVSSAPIRDDEGNIIAAINVWHDITEIKKSEEEIKRNNKILNGINKIFQAGLRVKSEEELAQIALKVIEEIIGSSFGFICEIASKKLLNIIATSFSGLKEHKTSDGKQLIMETDLPIKGIRWSVISEAKPLIFNNANKHPKWIEPPEGHIKIKSFLGVPLIYAGEVFGEIGLVHKDKDFSKDDLEVVESISFAVVEALMSYKSRNQLTEYKIKLEELVKKFKDSEESFRALAENSPDLIARINTDFKYLFVNFKVLELQGNYPDVYIGRNFEEAGASKECAEMWRSKYQKIMDTGELQNFEYSSSTKDGFRYFETTAVPEYNSKGEIESILSISRDITERKKSERQLKKTITELQRSNKELQSFAYITSHDLQEPLRTIASYAQLIERRYKGRLDKDADEFIEYMVDGAKRMKSMIQGLLDYSRVGTKGNEFKEFKAQDALDYALSNLESAITENNAEIEIDSLPVIFADEDQIARVFQNLIGNALKFCREGAKPKIHISAGKKGNEYVFSVSDNGIGMEEQYGDHIFEVFKRLHSIDEYQGAGIGLAIVKRIIDRHGGHVWVESELGKGSTFYFTIPVRNKAILRIINEIK